MTKDYKDVSKIFKALASPERLQIIVELTRLNGDKCSVNIVKDNLGLHQSTVSRHLQILSNIGIVEGVRHGSEVCYRVTDKRILEIMKIISPDS